MDGQDTRQAAVRRRLHRPDEPHPLDLSGRQQPRLAEHDLRPDPGGIRGPGARPDRRRRGSAPARDDLRHAQREGSPLRDRERVRGEGRAAAAGNLGDDHRPQRPHAVGPDGRCLLRLHQPCAPVCGRHELRTRCDRDVPAHRGARAARRTIPDCLSQRRSTQRVRRIRSTGRRDRHAAARLRRQWLRQHRRRLLRHHAGPYPRGGPRRSRDDAASPDWPAPFKG